VMLENYSNLVSVGEAACYLNTWNLDSSWVWGNKW
jgi:hypothetical protein